MIRSTNSSLLRKSALIALGLSLALLPVTSLQAADAAKPMADKAAALPLAASFEKVTGGEKGPYVLHLKNTSHETVKVTAKILLAVAFHADSKARNLPEHAVAAGEVWTIDDLVVADKVILTAHGFAPLELEVK